VLGVSVAAGAAVTAAILALRSAGPAVPSDAAIAQLDPGDDPAPPVDARVAPRPDPWAPTPGPTPASPGPRSDPWNQPLPAVPGKRVEIGQGVALIVPPGFTTKVEDEAVIAEDSRGVLIVAGPLELEVDEPDQFARSYARHAGMSLEGVQRMSIGGQDRPMVVLRGKYKGVRVKHVAVPVIGPGYDVVVILQVPARIERRQEILSLAFDLYTRRIVLP
jgi:hypothetical protein